MKTIANTEPLPTEAEIKNFQEFWNKYRIVQESPEMMLNILVEVGLISLEDANSDRERHLSNLSNSRDGLKAKYQIS